MCPEHVVLGESERIAERVVDMRLRGCVNDGVNLFRREHVRDEVGGQNVALDEFEVGTVLDRVEVAQGAAVVHLVQHDHLPRRRCEYTRAPPLHARVPLAHLVLRVLLHQQDDNM